MAKRFSAGFLGSIIIHAGALTLGIITIRAPEIAKSADVIDVALIADNASAIGSDNAPIVVSNDTQNEEVEKEDEAKPEAPQPRVEPSPTEIAQNSSKIQEKSVKKSEPPKQPAAKPVETPFSAQFDIAAASSKASGVSSPERKAPRLTTNTGKSSLNQSGGGSALQADLESILRSQVQKCWREPADLANPARLIVDVQIELGQDGKLIKQPKLIYPESVMGIDSSTKVAIDNALRAARQCAPYILPIKRYEEWKIFTFRFDPRKMKRN